jgi:hypothetical protein
MDVLDCLTADLLNCLDFYVLFAFYFFCRPVFLLVFLFLHVSYLVCAFCIFFQVCAV